MSSRDREIGISPETLEFLRIALSTLPINDVRQFVVLMEALGSAPCSEAQSVVNTRMRRALATRQRPRRYGWQPRKSVHRFG
jgi:hypothetical protein